MGSHFEVDEEFKAIKYMRSNIALNITQLFDASHETTIRTKDLMDLYHDVFGACGRESFRTTTRRMRLNGWIKRTYIDPPFVEWEANPGVLDQLELLKKIKAAKLAKEVSKHKFLLSYFKEEQ